LLLSPPAALLLVSHPPWPYVTQAGLALFFFVTVFDMRSSPRRAGEAASSPARPIADAGQEALPLKHSVM
jgi:hypothetical protein